VECHHTIISFNKHLPRKRYNPVVSNIKYNHPKSPAQQQLLRDISQENTHTHEKQRKIEKIINQNFVSILLCYILQIITSSLFVGGSFIQKDDWVF